MTLRPRHAVPLLILAALGGASAAEPVKLRPLPPILADGTGGGLRGPEAVAFDGRSRLVVADTGNGRLLLYTIAAEGIAPDGEIRLPELPRPIRVQVGSNGDILALDGRLRRVGRIAAGGAFKGYIAGGGSSPGPMVPRSIALDREDNLYVLDLFQERVLVLDPSGAALRSIAWPKGERFFSDLSVDARGTVHVVQSVGRRVFSAGRDAAALAPLTGPLHQDLAFPTAIAADAAGRLFLADQNGGGIVILGADGSFRGRQSGPGWKEGALRYPAGLAAGRDLLFVADRENNRVQVFAVME